MYGATAMHAIPPDAYLGGYESQVRTLADAYRRLEQIALHSTDPRTRAYALAGVPVEARRCPCCGQVVPA